MRSVVLILGALMLVSGTAMASIDNWVIRCGFEDNVAPYGVDSMTRFGVTTGASWDFDSFDAAHPPILDAKHDLAFYYIGDYYTMYPSWPPPDGRHGTGDLPTYPDAGLLKDMRQPFSTVGEPEYWWAATQAPITGATMSFVWEVDAGAAAVPSSIYVKLWGNSDLEAVNIHGDLDLLSLGTGVHKITNIPQFGLYAGKYPLVHDWQFEAGGIPEPGTLVLIASGLVGMAGMRRRK
jgi:hypothetical protein